MTTEERLDRAEAAIRAARDDRDAAPYMEAEKRAAAEAVVRICAEFGAEDSLTARGPR